MVLEASANSMLRYHAARRYTGLLLHTLCIVTVMLHADASAQASRANGDDGSPAVIADPEFRANPGDIVSLPIRIRNQEAMPRRTLVLIKGLPPNIHLSEGKVFGAGIWVIHPDRLASLSAKISPDATGGVDISIFLTTPEGDAIAERRSRLIIGSPSRPAAPTSAAQGASPREPAQSAAERAIPLARLDDETRVLANKLMIKGNDSMKVGSVIVARQYYERAAELGLADGAAALAMTYDAEQLARMTNLVGVEPNKEMAKKWYEKAKQLRSQDTSAQVR